MPFAFQGQDDDDNGEQETEDFIRFGHGFHHGFHGGGRFGRRWGWGSRHWGWGRRWPFLGWAPSTSPLLPWAQSCLAQLFGPQVVQDGIMGPNTRQAIAQFQQQQQLPVTGTLDPNTVSALQAACSGQQPQGGGATAQPSGAAGESEYDLSPRDTSPCPKGGRFPGWSAGDLDIAKQQWKSGVHDKNKVTDAIFWARHADWNGRFLPGGKSSPEIENLKAEWRYLKCIVVRLADIDEPLAMHELPVSYEGPNPDTRQSGRWIQRDGKIVLLGV